MWSASRTEDKFVAIVEDDEGVGGMRGCEKGDTHFGFVDVIFRRWGTKVRRFVEVLYSCSYIGVEPLQHTQ